MRLRFYKWVRVGKGLTREFLAEFVVLNPHPKTKSSTVWTTEPLPIEKKSGDVSFTLKGVGFKTNWIEGRTNSFPGYIYLNPVEIVPKFEAHEKGWPTAEWKAEDMDLMDSSGNCAPKQLNDPASLFLSPHEPAWKLTVKFFGSEQESAASNTVWVLRNVRVPRAADYTPLSGGHQTDGVLLVPVALVGAGEATYSDNSLVGISAHLSVDWNMIRFGSSSSDTVDTTNTYLAMQIIDMMGDQRLTIRAVAPGKCRNINMAVEIRKRG